MGRDLKLPHTLQPPSQYGFRLLQKSPENKNLHHRVHRTPIVSRTVQRKNFFPSTSFQKITQKKN